MKANHIDIFTKSIHEVELTMDESTIVNIQIIGQENPHLPYILPGFVDAHVHIESSMLTPAQFARLAVVHGTVATVSDPHEIANVLGIKGIEYMIEDGKRVPLKFCFGAPSCVPATIFETSGATIDSNDIKNLMKNPDIGYLAEVMNFPGVLHEDEELLSKIAWAKLNNKPIDGHAPGLRGEDAKRYANAGITTDHECFTYEEAREKLDYGVKILIREGSAAKNFDTLIPLIENFSDHIMFCSDDKHPDSLVLGHINALLRKALTLGYDLWKVLRAACINPVEHYDLPVGLLRKGDPADFIVIDNIKNFSILGTWIDGKQVAQNGQSFIPDLRSKHINHFNCKPKEISDFVVKATKTHNSSKIIQVIDGQLITKHMTASLNIVDGIVQPDVTKDILKITVVNRYNNAPPAIAFIHNFGLKIGAIASSIAHDSHNIIAVGCSDEAITKVVNLLINEAGGIAAVSNTEQIIIPLPIAGIMTDCDGYELAAQYSKIDHFVKKELSTNLQSPFMSLSFMALLVIPELKLSDKGLFDVNRFEFTILE